MGDSHLCNAIEEKLDERIKQEAGQQVCISVCLAMDVGPQEERSSDDGHKGHLHNQVRISAIPACK